MENSQTMRLVPGSSVKVTSKRVKSTCAWAPGGVSKRSSNAGTGAGRSSWTARLTPGVDGDGLRRNHAPLTDPSQDATASQRGGAGSGFHPAMVRAHARAFALSVTPGNRRRNSIAADSSLS